ncbi:MAG TPA: VOC family protein [Gemmatimonadaceae bacterium]|nr:VOC family protein [Gemmatimonadaceae bacterium]
MANEPRFKAAYPYQRDILALPVTDLDAASQWYCEHFGMVEVERIAQPTPTVILERDDARIGFAINGGDASQEGAAILVSNIQGVKDELEAKGANSGDWRIDERDGQKYQVFFVVAPDGLCYYFHEPIERSV